MNMRDVSRRDSRPTKPISVWAPVRYSEPQIQRVRGSAYFFLCATAIISGIVVVQVASAGLSLKQELVDETSMGFKTILEATQKLGKAQAQEASILFKRSQDIFNAIHAEAWFTTLPSTQKMTQDPAFEAARAVITTGQTLAQAGEKFSLTFKELNDFGKRLFDAQKVTSTVDHLSLSLTDELKKHLPQLAQAQLLLQKASASLVEVPRAFIPEEMRERVHMGEEALVFLTDLMRTMQEDMPALLTLLGDSQPHKILVLLQNNAELRPSGGFIGNYMLVETSDGYITRSDVFDIYSADHKLKEIIASPPEIAPVSPRFFMRDANYSGHFPLSAQKVAWFLEKEGGPSVDTVIAVDQWIAQELLRFTGPISIPELKQPLTVANFNLIVSYVVESKILGKEDPKALLRTLIPAVQKILLTRADPVSLMPVMHEAVSAKHILAYSKEPHVQALFERHTMAGLMKKPAEKEDYLAVVHTSIGGNKSDVYVGETLEHVSFIEDDGTVTDELTISRSHGWSREIENTLLRTTRAFGFSQITPEVMCIAGKCPNKHMLRVYVPKGSVLESTTSDELTTKEDLELGTTYFSLPFTVDVGKTQSVKIRYRLPFKLNLRAADTYTLTAHKQPGQDDVTFVKKIVPDDAVLLHTHFPSSGFADGTGAWKFEMPFERDLSFTSVVGR